MNIPNINYADINQQLSFINDSFKDEFFKIRNELKVNRLLTVKKINSIISNYDCSIVIEASIFEYTLIYCIINNIITSLLNAIYNEKLNDIIAFLSKYSINNVKELTSRVTNHQTLAFMKPHELYPETYENIIRKQTLKEEKKKNIATTDLYQCYKCGERKCQVTELQTRSCDEPSTKFVVCLVCNNVFKK